MLFDELFRRLSQPLFRLVALSILAPAGLLPPAALHAQVTFNGLETTLLTGMKGPNGVTMDRSGNLYVADTYNNRVVELPAGGGALVVLASGLTQPNCVALDGAGNVYFSEYGYGAQMIPAGGGAPVPLPISGIKPASEPFGIALDAAGNLFLSDATSGLVIKLPRNGAGWGFQSIVASGLKFPAGIAVDAGGNVYVAEGNNADVVEVPWQGTGYGTPFSLAGGFAFPTGVAVDSAGNVFIADEQGDQIVEDPVDGGRLIFLPFSGFNLPSGIALDGKGNVIVADTNNNRIVELQLASVGFGNVAAGSTLGQRMSFTVSAGTTVGGIAVLTSGVAGQDFARTSATTCTASAYPSEAICQVAVSFSPSATGVRRGALVFYDGKGGQLATVQL